MTPDPTENSATIHLDYGADSAAFDVSDLHICPQGLCIKTRWCFEPGTELSVNFQLFDSSSGPNGRLLKTEGVVVECEHDMDGDGYQVTVVFLEVTDDILAIIRDVPVSLALPG